MAFCRLVFPILVLSVISTFASVQVPVFIWGDLDGKSSKANPLTSLTPEEFQGILKRELVSDPFTVVFIDETLSVEDFSRKNLDGDSSFPYLHERIGDALYLPSVTDAYSVLDSLADKEKVNFVKLPEDELSAEIEPDSGKYLFIVLKDAQEGESRSELLKRHNDFMEEIYSKLQDQYEKVVAIYTAEYPSWIIPETHSRVRRQVTNSTGTMYAMDGLKLYADTIYVNNVALSGFSNSNSTFDADSMSTEMYFENNTLILNFRMMGGYWFFDSVFLDQTEPQQFRHELPPVSEVYAFMGFSYRCGQNVTFRNNTVKYTLTFVDMKVQPFFTQSNSSDPLPFGESLNCVGFFSVPIWAGLFVVFILLAITFYGIMMMLDIRTMDRFDDPKGKTITINAGE